MTFTFFFRNNCFWGVTPHDILQHLCNRPRVLYWKARILWYLRDVLLFEVFLHVYINTQWSVFLQIFCHLFLNFFLTVDMFNVSLLNTILTYPTLFNSSVRSALKLFYVWVNKSVQTKNEHYVIAPVVNICGCICNTILNCYFTCDLLKSKLWQHIAWHIMTNMNVIWHRCCMRARPERTQARFFDD